MHKLMEFICDEMEELERKADKDGKLSMSEVQYLDTLAHTKKNLLKADEMWEESEYSGAENDVYARGNRSYARGRGGNARRDRMGRYSRTRGYSMANDEMIEGLHELMQDAPDEATKKEFQRFIQKIEQM